jgi:hypothetical protein
MSEWITDRLPTPEDADEYRLVYYTNEDNGTVTKERFSDIELGCPWMPIPKSIYPKPYVRPEPKRWKPKLDQGYWAVEHTGVILLQWTGNNSDLSHYHSGNCFQTESQAFEAARRVSKTLLNYHEELNNAE